jgi:hypothetical protein
VNVADATHGRDFWSVSKTFSQNNNVLRSVEVGRSLRGQGGGSRVEPGLYAQIIVADIITKVREPNDDWIALAVDQMGKPEADIWRYVAQRDDSVLLANLIHITRQIFSHSRVGKAAVFVLRSFVVLRELSEFDIRNMLPELEHDFCALWNHPLLQKRVGSRLKAFSFRYAFFTSPYIMAVMTP